MIVLKDKTECCGCEGCIQVCPKQCINLMQDREGYMYPKIDSDRCIDCHLCENVCPYLSCKSGHKQQSDRKPLIALAAKNRNCTIVDNSSSGGVFYELAKSVIEQDGVVFGAILTEGHEVIHTHTTTVVGLSKMMGSKYVQSRIGRSFSKVEEFLKMGKRVLFSGTPCQIVGLRKYLRKDFSNLITVDFVCHGVPSPGIWMKYIKHVMASLPENRENDIKINFREKKGFSWSDYGFSIKSGTESLFETRSVENPYIRAFITDNCLRPSCYQCKYKNNTSSDITLGDFWGIDKISPEFYDEKGVSLIVIKTQKGADLIPYDKFVTKEVQYLQVTQYNRAINHSSPKPITRKLFFKLATNHKYTVEDAVKRIVPIESSLSLWEKLKYMPIKIMRFINRKAKNR